MNQERCLVIFVKYPEEGNVKSRLVPGGADCLVADLYCCFIEDLLERLSVGDYRFLMAFDPPEKEGVWKYTLRNWSLVSLYIAGIAPRWLVRFYH